MIEIPETGYLKLPIVIGDTKKEPPIVGLIPMSKSAWYAGIQSGKYPKPVKLGVRSAAWKVEDIRALITQLGGE